MFICVLTELFINFERNNKRSQTKKLSNPIWESIVFLISLWSKPSLLLFIMCQTSSTHIHTKTHTQVNTQRHLTLKSNKHYRNFIDCLTNKMKCYSIHQMPLEQKPAFFRCIEYLVPISYSLITSFETSIVFTQRIALLRRFLKRNREKRMPYTWYTEKWL